MKNLVRSGIAKVSQAGMYIDQSDSTSGEAVSLVLIILVIESEKVCSQVIFSVSWQEFCRDKGQSHGDTLSVPGYRSHRMGCHQ